MVLVRVAFFTLMERKFLSVTHNRMGPIKLGFIGLLQPFRDALKLFFKLDFNLKGFIFFIYLSIPFFILLFRLIIWLVFIFWGFLLYLNFSFLYFLALSSFFVYFIIYVGWSSSSTFSLLGSYRSSAQSVSYEVVLILCVLIFCFYVYDLNFALLLNYFSGLIIIFGSFFIWILSCLAESSRSPFDFVEGESELVSGFNTEVRGGLFSLVFIREYSSIIFLCFLTGFIFLSFILMLIYSIVLMYFFLWVRCSFPRLRYDCFLMFGWKGASLVVLGVFFYFL